MWGRKAVAEKDWTVEPITGVPQWQRHESPRPDLLAVTADAIRMSGHDPRDVNKVDCVAKLSNLIKGVGAHYLRTGNAAAADGMEQLTTRADFSIDLLWDYFSHHGALGVAAQQKVVEHFTNGDAAGILAGMIRDGECGFGFAGGDRI